MRGRVASLALAGMLVTSLASAQPSGSPAPRASAEEPAPHVVDPAGSAGGDVMAAEAIFLEARALMRERRFAEACPKLMASVRLDRAYGAMLNLADCYMNTGRPASAWYWFRESAALASAQGQRERAVFARERALEVEPSLCRLAVRTAAPLPSDLTVRRDGVVVEAAALGVPVPVDPGLHVVEASSAARPAFRTEVRVEPPPGGGECGAHEVVLPRFDPLPVPVREAEPRPSAQPSSAWSGRHVAAIVSGAGGLVALAIAGGFSIDALNTKDQADRLCGPRGCTAEGQRLTADAGRSADVATVSVVVGAGLLAAGALLWFTAPSLRPKVARGLTLQF